MKFSQIRNYKVDYLLPYRAEANSVEDSRCKGYFHNRTLMVGESESVVIGQIRALGGIPVSIAPLKRRLPFLTRFSPDYRQQFLRAIYYNCSGMSAAKALEAVIESDKTATRAHLTAALAIIKRGGGFLEAMDSIGAYDESTLAILEAGERTGTLPEAINTAVEHLQSNAITTKLMLGMGAIAAIDLFFAVSSLLGNRFGMLPRMAASIPESLKGEKLASITRAIRISYLTNDIMLWATFALFFAAVVGTYSYFDKDKSFRAWVDSKVQQIPALGTTIREGAIASSFRVAASLLKGGVRLAMAIEIAKKSTRVPDVINYWTEAGMRAENGDSVAAALAQPLLDNSNQLLVSAHTNSKQLADSFFVIASRSSETAKKAAKRFSIILFFLMSGYTMLAVSSSLYVLWIQNESLISGLQSE